MIKEEIEKLLSDALEKIGIEGENISISFSSLPQICQFQCNGAFSLAKKYGKNPLELASAVVDAIGENEEYDFFVVKPAFINIKFKNTCYKNLAEKLMNDDRAGVSKISNAKVLIDYGGANVAKTLHVGHLRPAIIGESLKRLYRFLGEEVISDVHLGDWGLQMGLNELQLYEDGVLDFYFGKTDKKYEITLEMLNEAYPKASARKNVDEEFKKKAEEWTLKIQHKEEPFYQIYQEIKKVSVVKIKENYKALGAEFDLWNGESDCADYIDDAITRIVDKGLTRESGGALIVDVANENENIPIPKKSEDEPQRYKNPMPPAIIKKYNGAMLYATTDIATIYMRNKTYKNLDRIEYITDQRQNMHFTQVFRVCKLSGISPENQQLLHIGHGTMNGEDGKPFKTRSGDTLKLEDIILMLTTKAGEKLKSNGVEYDDALALKIGVGAMKFGDLSNNVGKDYLFDLDKFLSFEGKTGPYLQYTVCRINSILNKTDVKTNDFEIYNEEQKDILYKILKLNSSYEVCYKEKSLNNLCLASYDLASAFSTFYNNHKILSESDLIKKSSYLNLLNLVKKSLTQALDVLGIEVPEKM